ncbi:MAG: DNA polymerase III subunit gamma/tau [Patescibacteria group bacterium]
MSQTLYRKYRPQKFSDVIGQQHIIQTLVNSIKNGRIGHAYLFAGPRGTGKTTVARLLAKAVNCSYMKDTDLSAKALASAEPCLECENCKNIQDGRSLDIIEIDAASNTGVDNIRELRETVKLPPTRAKYKVYIIDEVHMLSTGAFNALLKTLEEPPAHVIFILATTEIHKVPDTIISRCQRFDFARLSLENIIKKLSSIAKSEGVEIEKNALEMIAISAEGGMRDAESLLAQVISLEDKKITSKEVEEILGTTDRESVEKMAEIMIDKNANEAIELANKLARDGYDLEVFNKSFLNYLRQLLLISIDEKLSEKLSLELTSEQIKKALKIARGHTREILKIIEAFSEIQNKIKSSFIPQLPIEIAIVKLSGKYEVENIEPEIKQDEKPSSYQPIEPSGNSNKIARPEIKKVEHQDNASAKDLNITVGEIKNKWGDLIRETKPYNHSLSAFLQNCQPVEIKEERLIIATKYKFYKDTLSENKNKLTIENVLAKLLGSNIRVNFVSEDEAGIKIQSTSPAPKDSPSSNIPRETNSLLNDAMEMMGGKIIEE